MEIRAKKQSIANVMGFHFGERLDVRCLQSRERPLAGYGAAASVGVGHLQAKCALTEARGNENRFPDR